MTNASNSKKKTSTDVATKATLLADTSNHTTSSSSGIEEDASLSSSTSATVKFNDAIEVHRIPRVSEDEIEELYYLSSDIETFQYEVYQQAIELQTAIQYGIVINIEDDDEFAGITGQFQGLLMR